MRWLWMATMLLVAFAVSAPPSSAQAPREDVMWARTTTETITLDGVLDEPGWAAAESVTIDWAVDAGLPGSGWKVESGNLAAVDPLHAQIKFLVVGNQLYMGAKVTDASIGGSKNFNRFDGFLMAIKDHLDPGFPKPPAEYFYVWWYPESTDPQPPGEDPTFQGRWSDGAGLPRTPEQIAAWDAVTVVHGLSNDDTTPDQDWVTEMRFDLTVMGYDVTQGNGDIVEWNIGIYDGDYAWPLDAAKFTCNRTWWECPWGNAAWYSEVRLHARPDVTVASGPVPEIGPEYVINEITDANVTVDGDLDEPAWSDIDVLSFDIRWDDNALRATYPGVAQYRAGQFQPDVYGGQAFVFDPADATVKMFTKGDWLYLGFDVRDGYVQYHPDFDRWDGILLTLNDRTEVSPDNVPLPRRLSFQVAADGSGTAQDYLLTLLTQAQAELGLSLKANTTVDTLGLDVDEGYTAEVAIDLKGLGYPTGLGDRSLFLGVNLLDGDSVSDPITDSYGTRTWWYREYEGECCASWIYMAPGGTAVDPDPAALVGNSWARSYPNPSVRPTIQYSLAARSDVTLEVFDLRGRLVERRRVGSREAGVQELVFDGSNVASGVYLYRLRVVDPSSGAPRATLGGKLLLLH
jgi:hypothetical protein